MRNHGSYRRIVWLLVFLLLWGAVPASGGFFDSLSTEKEKQIGEEFFLELQSAYPISTDPFISSYINRLGHKLEAQQPPHPFKYRFYVLDDPTMNAFAVPGGYVFIHSGFIRLMDREGELAGVMAHEISHIYARHMARMMDESKGVTIATLVFYHKRRTDGQRNPWSTKQANVVTAEARDIAGVSGESALPNLGAVHIQQENLGMNRISDVVSRNIGEKAWGRGGSAAAEFRTGRAVATICVLAVDKGKVISREDWIAGRSNVE